MAATRMMFRTVVTGDGIGTVEAVVLDAPANPGHVVMYAHIGQHGEGTWEYVRRNTRDASPNERRPLLRELQGIYGAIKRDVKSGD